MITRDECTGQGSGGRHKDALSPYRRFSICRIADFQSAVRQFGRAFWPLQSLAEYNSAIQQITNLRYKDADLGLAGRAVDAIDRGLEQFRSGIAVRR
jgi:hypothetical protein